MKVISINYRQGYEHRYPAASEDVAAVYRELLTMYAPAKIGIYGGYAYFGTLGVGEDPPQGLPPDEILPTQFRSRQFGYFAGVPTDDYLATPITAPAALLSRFPPTLIIPERAHST
jgi:acetyl esterase/lipase